MLDQLHTHFETGPFAGLPRAYFRVALIDPPWTFRAWSAKGESKRASRHYTCQTLESITALPVSDLMTADAVAFLWIIQSHLPQGLHAIQAWGFTYKTIAFVWVKPRIGMGFHTRAGAELCLLATRGKGYQRQDKGVRQVVRADVREHSRKPDEVRTRIDRLVGDIPRIELFAREQAPGWSAWGDQLQLNLFGGNAR